MQLLYCNKIHYFEYLLLTNLDSTWDLMFWELCAKYWLSYSTVKCNSINFLFLCILILKKSKLKLKWSLNEVKAISIFSSGVQQQSCKPRKINIGQTNQGPSHTPFCLRRDFPYTKSNFLTGSEVQIFSFKKKI